jgi:hypothetical protein
MKIYKYFFAISPLLLVGGTIGGIYIFSQQRKESKTISYDHLKEDVFKHIINKIKPISFTPYIEIDEKGGYVWNDKAIVFAVKKIFTSLNKYEGQISFNIKVCSTRRFIIDFI